MLDIPKFIPSLLSLNYNGNQGKSWGTFVFTVEKKLQHAMPN